MVDERRVTVMGLVGGALVIGGGRVPRLSTAYLLLSLFGLTLFPAVFSKQTTLTLHGGSCRTSGCKTLDSWATGQNASHGV